MKRVCAVIGANYGDEGKGLITDYLSARNTMVVRFNGGAQAGHTVVTPDCRHVFRHFGSGTLAGAKTFLSHFFVVNPILYNKEYSHLQTKAYIDPECTVTTPYDMLINQLIEKARGNKRHGSCGVGINETVVRNETIKLTMADLFDGFKLAEKLDYIRFVYSPQRLNQLGISETVDFFSNDVVISNFMHDIKSMMSTCCVTPWQVGFGQHDLVFEGAQGLQLDEQSPDFPHVTRSRTGIHNVCKLMEMASINSPLEVYYVTRSYLTRHGAGPLPNEELWEEKIIDDQTNVKNDYQGSIRFAPMDIEALIRRISLDIGQRKIILKLAITWSELWGDGMCVVHEGRRAIMPIKRVVEIMQQRLGLAEVLTSYGPTRNDIRYQLKGKE